MNPARETTSKKREIVFILAIAFIVFLAYVVILAMTKIAPVKTPPEITAGSTSDQITLPEENQNIALQYLNSIVITSVQEGKNSALRNIISLAQKTNEDGTMEPICQKINIKGENGSELSLVNVACVTTQEPQPEEPSQ